jgi:hypothetical protein
MKVRMEEEKRRGRGWGAPQFRLYSAGIVLFDFEEYAACEKGVASCLVGIPVTFDV